MKNQVKIFLTAITFLKVLSLCVAYESFYRALGQPDRRSSGQMLSTTFTRSVNASDVFENEFLNTIQSKVFQDEDECEKHEDMPFDCRINGCQFNCHENTCHWKTEHCSVANCAVHCYDPCGCRAAGCLYDITTNQCRQGGGLCAVDNAYQFFGEFQCFWYLGQFYSRAGIICKSDANGPSMCEFNVGINMNGPRVETTISNYQWIFDLESVYQMSDPYNSRTELQLVGVFSEDGDQPLEIYDAVIVGNNENRGPARCLTYYIPLDDLRKQDMRYLVKGQYEACVKTVEPMYDSVGQRRFNVRFNNLLVLHEIDVFSLAGEMNKGIDICWNFRISETMQEMQIHGLPGWHIIFNEIIPLAFCYSRCMDVPDAGFVVAGFYIKKDWANTKDLDPDWKPPEENSRTLRNRFTYF